MQAIVRRLKSEDEGSHRPLIADSIWEDPGEASPFQAKPTGAFQEYSAILKDIAQEEEVSYLPF